MNQKDLRQLAKLAVKLFLDYVRWTQLIPMVVVWSFTILTVSAIFLISFQGEVNAMLDRLEPAAERVLGPPPEPAADTEAPEDENMSVTVTEDDILPWIYRIWGALALAGWAVSSIRAKIYGPKKPKALKRKLVLAAAASGMVILFLILGYVIGDFSGNTLPELMVPFILLPIILWIVSAWGLTISHVIDKIHALIDEMGEHEADQAAKTTA